MWDEVSYTLFEIFIFCPKIQLWFPEKIVDFLGENVVILDFLAVDNFDLTRKIVKKNLGWKTREIVVVLDFLAVDNFDFTRKIVKKKVGWKTLENVGVLSKLNFWTKIWIFE